MNDTASPKTLTTATPVSDATAAHFDDSIFLPQPVDEKALEAVRGVRAFADDSTLPTHEFFELASASPDLLRFWVSQESVVTGPFSQLLLLVAADIDNVHLRAAFLDVVLGEHGPVRNGVARSAHPYLLYQLSRSVGLELRAVEPLECTIAFLRDIESLTHSPLSALGVLGVGNERLLVTEYAAVRACFDAALPATDYRGFLSSNIEEDIGHSAIAEYLAAALVTGGGQIEVYAEAASHGVDARLRYYDQLVHSWNANGLPRHWLAVPPADHLIVTETQ